MVKVRHHTTAMRESPKIYPHKREENSPPNLWEKLRKMGNKEQREDTRLIRVFRVLFRFSRVVG